MKYAIIPDIHGNISTLNTMVEDAKAKGAEGYIFVGDFDLSNRCMDEYISRIRKLPNAYIVWGNQARYWDKQSYPNISEENLNYLLSLPNRIDMAVNAVPLYIAHSFGDFMAGYEFKEWQEEVRTLANGIYIFEDAFMPDNYESEDGRKILINSSSLGARKLSGDDIAQYIILNVSPREVVQIEKVKVIVKQESRGKILLERFFKMRSINKNWKECVTF